MSEPKQCASDRTECMWPHPEIVSLISHGDNYSEWPDNRIITITNPQWNMHAMDGGVTLRTHSTVHKWDTIPLPLYT